MVLLNVSLTMLGGVYLGLTKKAIEKYILKYNTKRLHSAIDYQTPNEVYYQAVNNLTPKGEKQLPKAS
ncbi:MAG: hypothetical protein COB07_09685 [Sulfurovum sp.]|nr:MAG: hypothetical protein COB07_09685 [Sulfurovum sp.]